MRNFYKLPIGALNVPLMVEVMRNQNEIFDENGNAKTLPPDTKKVALGVMQVTNGEALENVVLRRIGHDQKYPIPSAKVAGYDDYVAILSGQVMWLIGDECPAFNAGEVWWVNNKLDAVAVNKSGDDVVFIGIAIKTN